MRESETGVRKGKRQVDRPREREKERECVCVCKRERVCENEIGGNRKKTERMNERDFGAFISKTLNKETHISPTGLIIINYHHRTY